MMLDRDDIVMKAERLNIACLKPIFHQNAKYLASGNFASPNAKDSTSASPNARIPTCWYILR